MTTSDRSAVPAVEFDAHLARWEAAPVLPESHEGVGRLAQLLHDVGCGCGDKAAAESSYWRPIAFVATTAVMRGPAPADETAAVERVRALCDAAENRWPDFSPAGDPLPAVIPTADVRAALAGDPQ